MDDITLIDRTTGNSYALVLYGGVLKLIGVDRATNTDVFLRDTVTFIRYLLILDGDTLKLLEVS